MHVHLEIYILHHNKHKNRLQKTYKTSGENMTDIEIANSIKPEKIINIAKKLGLKNKEIETYGDFKAKISKKPQGSNNKLVLVTAINPTSAGIGKTTVSIGIADALNSMGESVCLALREPSLGPVFGIKGGATGGGRSYLSRNF